MRHKTNIIYLLFFAQWPTQPPIQWGSIPGGKAAGA